MKIIFRTLRDNMTEVWLGLLLFVGLPVVVALYLDWRAFLAVSFLMQSTILIILTYRGNN